MHPSEAIAHRPSALWDRLVGACQGLRGHRLPWVAVAFGTGVGLYFALPSEPGRVAAFAWVWLAISGLYMAWRTRGSVGVLFLLPAVLVLGGLTAQMRTLSVAGPVLPFRYYGAVEGRIVAMDRSTSGAVRLTLDQVRLDRLAPIRTPRRVRVSLQGDLPVPMPEPGARVMTTAHLLGPSGPTEPGGFDFQRHAWFQSLGAVGYTRVPLLRAGPDRDSLAAAVARTRARVAEALRARMPGQVGEVAAAITTGDRSGLSTDVTTALRASNLAHLLAISGLHMGLLVGFVFWAVRGGLALFPSIALHHPTRIWAALAAFPFAAAYLALSGGGVATQRAFVMAAVMLGAIVLGRRALSIRSVAIAALIILIWRPESLTGPGFQMSFAATAALILAFRWLTTLDLRGWTRGMRGQGLSLLLSSVVAGAATAPIAALHFNRVGHYGVLANMLAVPFMGLLVMPFLFIGLLLIPLGLEGPALAIAGFAIEWILLVADRVAALPGSVSAVAAPAWIVLPIMGLGMGILGAARGIGTRACGVVVLVLAGVIWLQSPRPDVLIADDGRLIGISGEQGRWLSRESGVSFVATTWLENDGDLRTQSDAAAGPKPDFAPIALHHAPTKTRLPRALEACARTGGWLIAATQPDDPPAGCRLFGPDELARTGALALFRDGEGGIAIQSARALQGARPWVPDLRQ